VTTFNKYFDPETLARIRPFALRARTAVEGLVVGMHRSPLRGHSIEFAQHREYVPGDDLRLVDWKIYARSDRYYLKQYEDETNLVCYFLLDQSTSMQYGAGTGGLSKLEYAQLIVVCLAYVTIAQQDSAGLITFSAGIDDWLPASGANSRLEDMIKVLEAGQGTQRTKIAETLQAAAQRISKPALLIIASDFFDDVDETLRALKIIRHMGHDVIVLHVLHPDEKKFPFDQMACFEGLEEAASIMTDPLLIAGAYRQALHAFEQRLRVGCQQVNVDYFALQTDESLAYRLPEILAHRLAKRS
jgi:uncharacterized protein (DUF58 family)